MAKLVARPQAKVVTISPPTGGVVKRYAYQQEPPFTCPAALDVVPVEGATGRRGISVRERWGSFTSPGSSANLLTVLNVAHGVTYQSLLIAASGGSLKKWTGSAWSSLGSGITTGHTLTAAPYGEKLYISNDTAAKVYNFGAGTLADVSVTEGTWPTNCRLVCTWNDRLFWANDPSQPHVWFASRAGTETDYDYAQTDAASAVSATSFVGGLIGHPLTALMPHNRQCLVFGAANACYILRGDPMNGGVLDQLSFVVGPISAKAWCKAADDSIVFLSNDGLYLIPAGCGAPPTSLSREKLPVDLLSLQNASNEAFLEYDVRYRRIHIYVTGTNAQRWWFDWQDGGFMPVTAPGTVTQICRHDPFDTATTSGVMVANSNGLHRLDQASNETIASAFITLGPFKLTQWNGQRAMIREALMKFRASTNDTTGTVTFYCGRDGEHAFAETTAGTPERKFTYTISQFINNRRAFPMVAGASVCVKIVLGDGTKNFTLDEGQMRAELIGKER